MTPEEYFSGFDKVLAKCLQDPAHQAALNECIVLFKSTKGTRTRIFLIGNGGSSAIAEHMAVDLTKNAGLKALTFSGSPMLTTFANDFGYEKVFQKLIEKFCESGDILVAISSGGTSKNILNAVQAARAQKMKVITFSGFSAENPLRKQGDINIWVDSKAFGYVEIIHNVLLHYINDAVIGSAEYVIN